MHQFTNSKRADLTFQKHLQKEIDNESISHKYKNEKNQIQLKICLTLTLLLSHRLWYCAAAHTMQVASDSKPEVDDDKDDGVNDSCALVLGNPPPMRVYTQSVGNKGKRYTSSDESSTDGESGYYRLSSSLFSDDEDFLCLQINDQNDGGVNEARALVSGNPPPMIVYTQSIGSEKNRYTSSDESSTDDESFSYRLKSSLCLDDNDFSCLQINDENDDGVNEARALVSRRNASPMMLGVRVYTQSVESKGNRYSSSDDGESGGYLLNSSLFSDDNDLSCLQIDHTE
jgi:hypothetical protein